MARKTVLVVDDERDLVDILEVNLRWDQYRVLVAGDGETAVAIADREVPDVMLLDLMLPGIGGLEVCRRVRANPRTAGIPIIMLTAKAEETDAVIGLSQGADDYVSKPFRVHELMARVAAQIRRGSRGAVEERRVSRWEELVIDSDRFVATLRDEPVALTTTQFKLLRHLLTLPGRVFTRDQLLDAACGADTISVDRTIDVHVAAIRRKLGDYGGYLLTVRGVGYKFAETPDDRSG